MGNCPSGNSPFGDCPLVNCPSGNCPSGKYLQGTVRRAKVHRENIHRRTVRIPLLLWSHKKLCINGFWLEICGSKIPRLHFYEYLMHGLSTVLNSLWVCSKSKDVKLRKYFLFEVIKKTQPGDFAESPIYFIHPTFCIIFKILIRRATCKDFQHQEPSW